MSNMFEGSDKEINVARARARNSNRGIKEIIAETKKEISGGSVEKVIEESRDVSLDVGVDPEVLALTKDVIDNATEMKVENIKVEVAHAQTTPIKAKNLPLQVNDIKDGKWVDNVNKVLALKKPGGAFSKSLQKENFNVNSSPYLVAFFKYLSDKVNQGVDENQKIGYSTIAYQTIVKALIESGELAKLADDEILMYLLESLKTDI